MTKWELQRRLAYYEELNGDFTERFDLDRIRIVELNTEIDRLHDECNARAKEQELVEESLGKALGFVDANDKVDLPVCKTSTLASIAVDKLSRCRFQFHGLIRERKEIDQILGKSLGYPLYEKFHDSDEDVVDTGEETIVSLAEEAAELIESLLSEVVESERTAMDSLESIGILKSELAATAQSRDRMRSYYANMERVYVGAIVMLSVVALCAGGLGIILGASGK